MIRVCADLTAQDTESEDNRIERWRERLAPWTEQVRTFRSEGFYEGSQPKAKSNASLAFIATSRVLSESGEVWTEIGQGLT